MKLNLEIIAHALAEAEEARLYGPPCEELDLEGARFFAGESRPGQLWLFEGCWPPPGFSGSALCRAPRGRLPALTEARVLAVSGRLSLGELANRVLETFAVYARWEDRLRRAVEENLSLREVVGIAAEVVRGRVLVSDKRLHLLADSHFYRAEGESADDFQGQPLPEPVVQAILSEALPQREQRSQLYVTGKKGQYGSLVYCLDLCVGDRREATCALMEEDRPLPSFALPLFQHISHDLSRSFFYHQGTTGRNSRPLRRLVEELLGQSATDNLRQEARRYRQSYPRCACLLVDVPADRRFSLEYVRFLCEETVEGSVAILFGEQVVMLLPGGADTTLLQNRLARLKDTAAGISDSAEELGDLYSLYLQAGEALRLGRQQSPEGQWFRFLDVRLDYLIGTCLETQPALMLRTAGFQRLLDHNGRAAVDYVHTLRVYLDHEMHVTESAEALYLHRSSFLKRLDKLQELLGEELQTPRGRLLLRLQLAQHR